MNVAAVMTALATQIDTIAGLRVYDTPSNTIVVPACVVGYPETITFDVSMGRGQDHIVLDVIVLAGKSSDRTAIDVLGAYMNGSGSASIKAVVEANNGTYSAFARVRVREATVDVVTIGGVEYLAGIFTLDIYGGN